MSDGLSDMASLHRIANELYLAAAELREVVREAERGHRGTALDPLATANEALSGSGYELRRVTTPGERQ